METIARYVIIIGLVLLVVGGILLVAARVGIPFGRLPGDIRIQTDGFTCMFPLATSIILSILLTILLNVIARLLR